MKTRRLVLGGLAAGLLALGVTMASALGIFGRGTSYYFPTWHLPPSADDGGDFGSVVQARMESLTNVVASLPMVLEAAERPVSNAGMRWNRWVDSWPLPLAARAPRHHPGAPLQAVHWLASRADDAQVAEAVVQRWPHWPTEVRMSWLHEVNPGQLARRTEYLPVLVDACADPVGVVAHPAMMILAQLQPADARADEALAVAITRFRANRGMVAVVVGGMTRAGPATLRALEAWRSSGDPADEAFAAVSLARLDPEHVQADEVVPRTWPRLSSLDQNAMVSVLGRPVYAPVVRRPWTAPFVGQLLASGWNVPMPGQLTDPSLALARILGNAGTNAVSAAPALLALFPRTNGVAPYAANAFVSVAAGAPHLVPLAVPYLTNASVAPALVLWLTSLGPDAVPARGAVEAIAADRLVLSTAPAPGMDPMIMRRYGLLPAGGGSGRGDPAGLRPSRNWVQAWQCPEGLRRWWPGVKGAAADPTGSAPLVTDRKEPVTLLELASRCLVRMTNGVLPEMR